MTLDKDDKIWLCKLGMVVVTYCLYALGPSDYIAMWRDNMQEQAQDAFDELEKE